MGIIKKFEDFKHNNLPNVDELNKMSSDEIQNLRLKLVQSSGYPDFNKSDQFLDELSIYREIRFKDETINRFVKYGKEVDEWEKNGGDKHDTDYRAKKLFKEITPENMYNLGIATDFHKFEKKYSEFKYLFGLELPEAAKKHLDLVKILKK